MAEQTTRQTGAVPVPNQITSLLAQALTGKKIWLGSGAIPAKDKSKYLTMQQAADQLGVAVTRNVGSKPVLPKEGSSVANSVKEYFAGQRPDIGDQLGRSQIARAQASNLLNTYATESQQISPILGRELSKSILEQGADAAKQSFLTPAGLDARTRAMSFDPEFIAEGRLPAAGEARPDFALPVPSNVTPQLASALLGVNVTAAGSAATANAPGSISFQTAANRLGIGVGTTATDTKQPPANSTPSRFVTDYYAGVTDLPDTLGRTAAAQDLAKSFLGKYATNYLGSTTSSQTVAVRNPITGVTTGFVQVPSTTNAAQAGVDVVANRILEQGYVPGIQSILTQRGTEAEKQPFYSALTSDPEARAFERAGGLYSLYAPSYQTKFEDIEGLAQRIQDTSFNRAKYEFLNRPGEDAELAAALAASPTAQAFAAPTYEARDFTGKFGVDTQSPEYQAARDKFAASLQRGFYAEPETASLKAFEAPATFAGVPVAPARPDANISPEGFGAEDVAYRTAVTKAAGYPDVYGADVNAAGLASLTPAQVASEAARAEAAYQSTGGAPAPIIAQAAAPAVPMREGGLASFAEGGEVEQGTPGQGELSGAAEAVRSAGRYGDSHLVHVNSEELGIMKGMFGEPTINPKTGLPEFFFKKLKKLLKKIIRPIAKIAQFVIPFILPPGVGNAVATGIASGFASKDKFFDFGAGLKSGLLSYGTGKLFGGLKDAGAVGKAASVADDVAAALPPSQTLTSSGLKLIDGRYINPTYFDDASAIITKSGSRVNPVSATGGIGGGVAEEVVEQAAAAPLDAAGRTTSFVAPQAPSAVASLFDDVTAAASKFSPTNLAATFAPSNVSTQLQQTGAGIKNLLTNTPGASEAFGKQFGEKQLGALALGATGMAAADEQEKFEEEQRRLQEQEEEERRRNIAFFRENTIPFEFSAAQGGQVDDEPGYDMARGGKVLPPRYLSGGGDGMSDSIPANIDGKRPARLADGEFVIPADVVSHLGNGSSKAGAKRLYDMMDRVRKARTGTKRQGREINPMRMMPA